MSTVSFVLLAALTPAGAAPLTVADVNAAVMAGNPDLAGAAASREAAEGALYASRGIFDPSLSIDAGTSRDRGIGFFQGFPFKSLSRQWDLGVGLGQTASTGTSWSLDLGMNRNYTRWFTADFGAGDQDRIQDAYRGSLRVGVTQQLLEGITRRWNLQSVLRAQQQVTTAELALEQRRQQLLAQAATAYWSWVYQEQLTVIARDNEAGAAEALRIGQARVAQGDLAPVEKTRLEAALVQAEVDRMTADAGAARAEDELLRIMGQGPEVDIEPAFAIEPPRATAPQNALEVALAGNLDLRLARAQADQAKLDVQIAKERMLPSLSATVSAGVASQSDTLGAATSNLFTEPFPTVGLSGQFSVPLGNRAARGGQDQALASAVSRDQSVRALEGQVRVDVEAQLRTLATADRRVALAEANVRLAQETLAAEEARAAVGRAIQRDVLEARTAVARARAEAAKAATDRQLAEIELRRLEGAL